MIKKSKMYEKNQDEYEFDDEYEDDEKDVDISKKLKRLIDLDELKIKKVRKDNGKSTTKFIFNGIDEDEQKYYFKHNFSFFVIVYFILVGCFLLRVSQVSL